MGGTLLPPYDFAILDEAHQCERWASAALTATLSQASVARLLRRLHRVYALPASYDAEIDEGMRGLVQSLARVPGDRYPLAANEAACDALATLQQSFFRLENWLYANWQAALKRPPDNPAEAERRRELSMRGVLAHIATIDRTALPPDEAINWVERYEGEGRYEVNSAPFDVFLAADAEHVDKLAGEGLLAPGSSAVYAVGVLALWIPPGSQAHVSKLDDLKNSEVRVIALANPKLAPYGAAAVESLQHAGIWDAVQAKIVYAENISMAKQYGTSKNADAVFTAYSLVLKEDGKVIQVAEALHAPIVQKLGIVTRSEHRDWAESFTRFVLGAGGRAVLARYGYQIH